MEILKSWARRNPRRIGRFLILIGVVTGGLSLNLQSNKSWQDYSVTEVARVTLPHQGKMERLYKLKTASGPVLQVSYPQLFNHALLMKQPLPVEVDTFAEHKGEAIEVEGLKLKSGEVLLEVEKVQALDRPQRIVGMLVGAILLLLGLWLLLKKPAPAI